MRDEEETPLIARGNDFPAKEGNLTAFLCLCAGTASISAFNFGYHTGVINVPKETIRCAVDNSTSGFPDCFVVDETQWGFIVAIMALGGMVGGMFAGYFADKYGRRMVIGSANVFFILGALLQALAMNEDYLSAGRFFVGVAAGVSSVVVPMYIGEITPANLRGAFGTMFQLCLTIGISFSQLLGLSLSNVPGWRWLLGFTVATSAIQLALLPFCCESPRFLVRKQETTKAEFVLSKLRGTLDVQDEINLMAIGQASKGPEEGTAIGRLLSNKSLRKPLMVIVVLSLAQQLSGINVVFFYSTDLFQAMAPDHSQLLTVLIGVWNVLLTLVAVFLMDKLGRRPLLLFGEIGMAVIASLFVISYVANIGVLGVISAFLYVLAFAVGLGPIPFLIVSEIFPTSHVATAASIAVPFNWAANFVVAQVFPILDEVLGEKYAFIPFIATNVIAFVFTYVFVPETKGRSIEEITATYSVSS